jgi:hypothetical protein
MALPSTYAPNDVTVLISKDSYTHVIGGYSEDSMVSVEPNSPRFEKYTGADNTSTRIYRADTSAMVTLSIQQTSFSNDILSQLHLSDIETLDATGYFQLTVKDNSGRTVFSTSSAFISTIPTIAYSNSMEIREWVIETFDTDTYLGGNSKITDTENGVYEAWGSRTIADDWID